MFSKGSKLIHFLTETETNLSTLIPLDTMMDKEKVQIDKDKESPHNEECENKSVADLITGITFFFWILTIF